jgi:hypothetical protein
MPTTLPIMIFVLVLALAVLGLAAMRKTKGLSTFRAESMQQFDAWLAGDAASQLGLGPGRCEIVKREETTDGKDGAITFYALTLFLRTDAGRYVMYKSTPTGPFVKLVELAVAKVVLKDKYIPE